MEKHYLQYCPDSGEILAKYCVTAQHMLIQNPAYGYLLGEADPVSQYIVNGEITTRPTMAVIQQGCTLSHVPAGCTLWINDEPYPVEESELELDLPPGRWQLRLTGFPWQDHELEITHGPENHPPA